ncbi:MAG: TIGR03089 family protein [Propionibacteriaceae bacterium]
MAHDLSLAHLLAARRRVRGSEPLLTYYDLGTGERTELSGTTFGNWVDKTANLLLDADVEPGDVIGLDLVADHPGHWVSMVWCAAVWQVGGIVALDDAAATIRVLGPGSVDDPPPAQLVLACSLHPFGLGFAPALHAPLVDYGVEVRGFPDVFVGVPAGDGPAWRDGRDTPLQSKLISGAAGDPDVRLLVRPGPPLPTVQQALLRPLRGAGSTVVVVGAADADRLAGLAMQEQTSS